MGSHGFRNFEGGHHHRDRLGKPWEAMDLVTLRAGITKVVVAVEVIVAVGVVTGGETSSGSHGKPWIS